MKPANLLSPKPSRWIAIIAIYAILAPTTGPAQSRHLAPEAVRSSVLKLGVGQWVRVREHSGAKLEGEITSIGPRLFQMQQRDAAEPPDVYYADVVKLRCARQARSEPFRGPNGESEAGMIVGAMMLAGAFIGIVVCGEGGCLK
jgi:hypothetical protein